MLQPNRIKIRAQTTNSYWDLRCFMYSCILNLSTYLQFRNLSTLIFLIYRTLISCHRKLLSNKRIYYSTQITTCAFIKITLQLPACMFFITLWVTLFLKIQPDLLVCWRKQEITHCYQEYISLFLLFVAVSSLSTKVNCFASGFWPMFIFRPHLPLRASQGGVANVNID